MEQSDQVKQPTRAEELFPLETPRPMQLRIIEEARKAFNDGYRFFILEAPVGSGKSAIAITIARLFLNSHIITPRKSLQNQYFHDFSDHVVVMKGRSSYPCTYDVAEGVAPVSRYDKIIRLIKEGNTPLLSPHDDHCGNAPCLDDKEEYNFCTEDYECPYHVAIDVAEASNHIVHNLHSFIFQTSFGGRFKERNLMIIDEAHEIEATIRDFISMKFMVKKLLKPEEIPTDFKTLKDWGEWLLKPEFTNTYSNTPGTSHGESERAQYTDRIRTLMSYDDTFKENFVVKQETDLISKRVRLQFVPEYIGQAAHKFLFSFGKKVMLMSGTIYSKELFCKNLGINPDQAYFCRVGSTFPKESRPIYMKKEYQIDTSHAKWVENFPKLITTVNGLLEKFPDVKGVIHSPSYLASNQLSHSLRNPRIINHDKMDFLTKLEKFMKDKTNKVLISPVCWQGMDFKDDLARFQIVLRVPYPNTNDPFLGYKVKKDFSWFNYQALIVFGQQIGRINRSESDFGVTILIDERFEKFLARSKKYIPQWVKEAIIK